MFNNIYEGKKVLITGNTGFKGSWLTCWLLKLGAKVFGYSSDIPSNPSLFEVLNLEEKIVHFNKDVRDYSSLRETVLEIKYDYSGYNTLLVSSDPAHSTEDVVGVPVGGSPTPITKNLHAMNIQADIKAKEFQKTLMAQMDSTVVKWFPGFDAEILTDWTSFPGMDEVFALEEIMHLVQSVEYDLIVFDTAPTGHTLKALTTPESINSFFSRNNDSFI